MNTYLTRLGVSPEIQAFFNAGAELIFHYGDMEEYYDKDIHKVPTTQNLWMAGSETAGQVIVTYSAMEAIAFITIHRQHYPNLAGLAFIAIGNRLKAAQIEWIRKHFRGRRVTLVFGNAPLGQITAIKFAAGIKNRPVRIFHISGQIIIHQQEKRHVFKQEQLSLHAFRQAFGFRSCIRTRQPLLALTFLEQLENDADRVL